MKRLAPLLKTLRATGIRVSELRYSMVEGRAPRQSGDLLKGKIRVILLPGRLCGKLLRFAGKQKPARGHHVTPFSEFKPLPHIDPRGDYKSAAGNFSFLCTNYR